MTKTPTAGEVQIAINNLHFSLMCPFEPTVTAQDKRYLSTLIKAAQQCEVVEVTEDYKRAAYIGQHVLRGFIAFNDELYSPEFYEIVERTVDAKKGE